MINFDYRAKMKLQYLYNYNDFIKDIELYFCLSICIIYFSYTFLIKPIYQRVFIWFLAGFSVNKAVDLQEKLQLKPIYEFIQRKDKRPTIVDFDPLRLEIIKQEITNQVTENLQEVKPKVEHQNSLPDVDIKKEVKDQLEKYDQLLK